MSIITKGSIQIGKSSESLIRSWWASYE